MRANYLFQGVYVPAGAHAVEFVYQPRSVTVGLLITLVALVVAVVLFIFGHVPLPLRPRPSRARGQVVPLRDANRRRGPRGR